MKTPKDLKRYFVTYGWNHHAEGLTLEEARESRQHAAHDFVGMGIIHDLDNVRAVVTGQNSYGEPLDSTDLFTAWVFLTRHVEQITEDGPRKDFMSAVRQAIDAGIQAQKNAEAAH